MEAIEGSPDDIAAVLGERLARTRLNKDLTQVEVAKLAGITRKAVLNAEKGRCTLSTFVAIMRALGQTDHLDGLLPEPPISPVQLSKLQGKTRKRASGKTEVGPEVNLGW